ncbi:MAG: AtpZ/AtpI family protein [Planctomycetota bacterium]|nr:MAG: AtpZ/AtpI family protein [Planctomycetota bacterium]
MMTSLGDKKAGKRITSGSMRLAGTGVELAATIVVACLLGYWIDRRFESGPWGLVICSVLGIVGGLYNMIRQSVQELFGNAENEEHKEGAKSENNSAES